MASVVHPRAAEDDEKAPMLPSRVLPTFSPQGDSGLTAFHQGKIFEKCMTLPAPVRSCLGCCGHAIIIAVLLWVLVWCSLTALVRLTPSYASASVFGAAAPACAILDYDAADVLSGDALVIGTHENVIGSSFDSAANFDLSGVWWLNWDKGFFTDIYMSSRSEVVISFAQSKFDANTTTYPKVMRLPGAGLSHRWSYSNTYYALGTMLWHAWSWCETCIYSSLEFDWTDRHLATLKGFGTDNFVYVSEDQWFRPNLGHMWNYHLTRVVYGNGTRHPEWWPVFEQFMSGYKVRTWGETTYCKRQCEVYMQLLFQSVSLGCEACARMCP